MIEIEAKFKLSTEVSRTQLLDKLAPKLSAPLAEKHQIDTVFLLPEQVDAPIVPGSKIMRVRDVRSRSEERRVGKECRSRWSPYH